MSTLATRDRVAKKQTQKIAPTAEPESKRKALVIQVRGAEPYRAWVEKLAKHDYEDIAGVVEKALRAYAKTIGFDDPQPER